MKKLSITVLLTCILVSLCTVFASAHHSMSLTGENRVYAGDTITLTYCAGGDIYGGTGRFSYDSSVLTLSSASPAGSGGCTAQIKGDRFMFYKENLASPVPAGTPIFRLTFKVSPSAAVGKKFDVSVSDVVFSDGERDISAGGCSYSTSIARPLSANCFLSSLSIKDVTITPEFASGVTEYSAEVAENVETVEIDAKTQDANANWTVASNAVAPGETTPVSVVVTAENGTTRTYIINITRPKSANAALASLSIEGYTLEPEFSADVHEYRVKLRDGVIPKVSAEAAMEVSAVSVGEYVSEGDGIGSISVRVTAQSGAELVYKIMLELPENTLPETAPQTGDESAAPENTSAAESADTTGDTEKPQGGIGFVLPLVIIAVLAVAAAVVVIIVIAKRKKDQPAPPSVSQRQVHSDTVVPADDNLEDEDLDEDDDYED